MSASSPALRDSDRELVQTLAGRFRHHRTVEIIRRFYGAAEVRQQLADRDSRTGDRLAYMSGLVVAEVGISRAAQVAA